MRWKRSVLLYGVVGYFRVSRLEQQARPAEVSFHTKTFGDPVIRTEIVQWQAGQVFETGFPDKDNIFSLFARK